MKRWRGKDQGFQAKIGKGGAGRRCLRGKADTATHWIPTGPFHWPSPANCLPPLSASPQSVLVLDVEPFPSSSIRSPCKVSANTYTNIALKFVFLRFNWTPVFLHTHFCWYSLISLLALLYFLSRVWYCAWVSFRCSSTAWKHKTRHQWMNTSSSEPHMTPRVSLHHKFLLKHTLPYRGTEPPSNSPPVSPSSLYCPGYFAPTEHAPSANVTYPAQHGPAGSKG